MLWCAVRRAKGGGPAPKPRTYQCQHCDRAFRTRKILNHHVGLVHKIKYKCAYCPNLYASSQGRDDHVKAVHVEGKYKCDQCNKTFAFASKLVEHQLSHQGLDLPCEECNKKFRDEHNLKKHVDEVHKPDLTQLYICHIKGCDYVCHVKRYLRDHLRKKHRLVVDASFLTPHSAV